MSAITLRPPTFSKATPHPGFKNPSISWLSEEWHVTHSTLPMWKSKRNVRIRYTSLEPSDPSIPKENTNKLDDLVTYQSLKSDKVSKVTGVDTASSNGEARGEWDWRGKGWLMIASSHWEVLCWGEEDTGNKYMVTMFAKTMFTPAGIDVYSQRRTGVSERTLKEMKKALAGVDDEMVQNMARDIFKITSDDSRTD